MAIASGGIPEHNDFRAARIVLVEEHVRLENAHDLEGVLRTFGSTARYDDEAWGEHFEGSSGVRSFYEQLMAALPDLQIDVQRRHLTDDSIVLEVIIRGTHLGPWRGLPPRGASSRFHYAAYTPSTPMIVLPGKKFTTIGGQS